MTLSTQSYKGTKDLYPEDKQILNYIFSVWQQTAISYGFLEYGAPLLESLDVYKAKSGAELVNEQTYAFTDRGEREVAIRPEMTPTISRMVAAKRNELSYPARLFSIANFMRYERPQKGREREFWQLNTDIFGDDTIYADLEVLSLAHSILMNFGANESMFEIKINDRRFINALFERYLGLDTDTSYKLSKLFDQKEKLSSEVYQKILSDVLANPDKEKLVLELDKNDLPKFVKSLPEYKQIESLLEKLKDLGINNAKFDLFLMRGLDYYTGTVFEVFDTNKDNRRSLFGGGRYDGLVSYFGAEPISAVGVAPGASTCLEFLKGHDLLPKYVNLVNYMIIPFEGFEFEALKLAKSLRAKNLNVEIDATSRKIAKKIKATDKKQIQNIVIIGEEEVKTKEYTVKNLASGKEQKLTVEQF